MLFFRKSYPEIISLHIPKNAGTSFRNILKSVYGDDQVACLNIKPNGTIGLNQEIYTENKLPKAKVIHGHFVFNALKNIFTLPENYKLITWVRDPVNRVVSNFYYLESRLKELLDEERNNLDILNKMQKTLIEFARADINRNRQAKFLAGSELMNFDFIGIFEYFDSELLRLAKVLEWKNIPEILHHNKTPVKDSKISDDILNEIRELNMEDMHIYNEALKIRENKIKHD
jgi:hypothetical protein